MTSIHNVHERVVAAPASRVGQLLDRLGTDDDRLWPSPAWLPMRLDGPVRVGASGGHGPIRYRVVEHEVSRRVRFAFDPRLGLDGYHEASVEPLGPGTSRVRHVLDATARGSMRLLWPSVVRPLHDAVVEDLLDNAEREATGRVAAPAGWSPRVRAFRRFEFPRPRSVPIPRRAELIRQRLQRADFGDAWEVSLIRGLPTDPAAWADGIFRSPPRWVVALLTVRNLLVGLVGIERGDASAFDPIAARDLAGGSGGGEVLLGVDGGHLDFRSSVLVDPPNRTVTLSTVVALHGWRGRLYWGIVRRFHGPVVRSMLARARRQLAEEARPRGSDSARRHGPASRGTGRR